MLGLIFVFKLFLSASAKFEFHSQIVLNKDQQSVGVTDLTNPDPRKLYKLLLKIINYSKRSYVFTFVKYIILSHIWVERAGKLLNLPGLFGNVSEGDSGWFILCSRKNVLQVETPWMLLVIPRGLSRFVLNLQKLSQIVADSKYLEVVFQSSNDVISVFLPPENIVTLWLAMDVKCLSLPAFSEQQHKWREKLRIGILAPTSYEIPNFICICTHMQLDVLFITYTLTSKRNLWKAKEKSYYLLVFILRFQNTLLSLILTSKCFPKHF